MKEKINYDRRRFLGTVVMSIGIGFMIGSPCKSRVYRNFLANLA